MSAPRVPGGNPADPFPLVNEALDILAHQEVYGRDPDTTALPTWGYLGGRWGGFAITGATLTLANNAENYIVVARATGVATVASNTTNWNNLTDYARVWHITTASSVPTVIRDYRGGPGGVHGQAALSAGAATTQCIIVAVSDESTPLTTGAAKVTFRVPYAFTLTGDKVRASVTSAPTGANLVVDINVNGSTILSTKLSIDATEKTSKTAATPPVVSNSSLAEDDEVTIDIDAVGSTLAGTGLKVTFIGEKT